MWWLFHSLVHAATWSVGPDGDHASVNDAVDAAIAGDVIEIEAGSFAASAVIDKPLTLRGAGVSSTLLHTETARPTLEVTGSFGVVIEDLTLVGAADHEALSVTEASVTVRRAFLRSDADVSGTRSVVRLRDAQFQVMASEFDGTGSEVMRGGLIDADGSNLSCEDCRFQWGRATDRGGAVFVRASDATFVRATFVDNEAQSGAAVATDGTAGNVVTIDDCRFERNQVLMSPGPGGGDGGAISATSTQIIVLNSEFRDNRSDVSGGALHLNGTFESQILRSVFEGNSSRHGGTLSASSPFGLTVRGNTFVRATASGDGGAVYLSEGGEADIHGNRFCECSAERGGLVASNGTAGGLNVTVRNNLASASHASDGASAFRAAGNSALVFVNNTVVGGFADDYLGWTSSGATSVVTNNAWVSNLGAEFGGEGSPEASYNLFWDNDGTPPDPSRTHVVADPDFIGSTDCAAAFRSGPDSPLVDAGDDEIVDVDGSRSDIGVYGGPGAAAWDLDGDGAIEEDCAPLDPDRAAPADEVVGDGMDQDCDGLDLCYVDADEDGVGGVMVRTGDCTEPGLAATSGDCDDEDPQTLDDCAALPRAWFCQHSGSPLHWMWFAVVAGVVRRRR